MAAVLTSEMNSSDNVAKYIAECRNMNIPILPPDVNESDKGFTVSGEKIRFGLAAVKNVGESAIDSILEIRREARFASVFDFCQRVDLRKVNKRVLESLIQCGAFDFTGYIRVFLRHDAVIELHHRDLSPETPEDLGELHPDVAAPNDQ